MELTDHQAKFLAHELTRRCPSDSLEKLASAVAGAQVDLNPQDGYPSLTVKKIPKAVLARCERGRDDLPSPEVAIARVAERVRQGGHSVPEEVTRCRFAAGRANFDRLSPVNLSTGRDADG